MTLMRDASLTPKCRELTPEEADALFWPPIGGKSKSAKQYCSTCPIQRICLQESIDGKYVGYWSGSTDDERLTWKKANKGYSDFLESLMPEEPDPDVRVVFRALYTAEAQPHYDWMDEVDAPEAELKLIDTSPELYLKLVV